MSKTRKRSDELADEFVRYVNEAGFEQKSPDDVPEDLRTTEADDGDFNWEIRPATSNSWIEKLVEQLPKGLPVAYLSLVQRYRFCSFAVGPLKFFANSGQDLFDELSTTVFKDKHLYSLLSKAGLHRLPGAR